MYEYQSGRAMPLALSKDARKALLMELSKLSPNMSYFEVGADTSSPRVEAWYGSEKVMDADLPYRAQGQWILTFEHFLQSEIARLEEINRRHF